MSERGIMNRFRRRLLRALTRPPFRDELGRKPWLEWIARAQAHLIRHVELKIDGWPKWSRPLRVVFLSDFHTGSHSGDVAISSLSGICRFTAWRPLTASVACFG
jgi:hypothetical protein